MKVLINGEDGLIQVRENPTAEVFDQIEQTIYSAGLAITEMKLDGEKGEVADFKARFEGMENLDSSLLEIQTIPLKDHIMTLIEHLDSGLQGAEENVIEIAEKHIQSNEESADVISTWCTEFGGLLAVLLQLQRTFGINLEDRNLAGKPYVQAVKELEQHLSESLEKMENGDRTAVADLFEFEISPIISGLRELLPTIREGIEAKLIPGQNTNEAES